MKKGKASIIKRILIVLLCVIIFIIAAGVIAYNVFLKPNVEKVLTAVDEVILSGELFDEIDPYMTDELLKQLEESVDDEVGEAHEIPSNKADGENTDIENKPTTKIDPKNPNSYKSKYDYIKANVRAEDFARGLEFASRIDIQYVLGIIEGGLTIPEKVELKEYLNERFTSTEQAEGLSLYIKYSHLLKK